MRKFGKRVCAFLNASMDDMLLLFKLSATNSGIFFSIISIAAVMTYVRKMPQNMPRKSGSVWKLDISSALVCAL